MTTLTDRRCLSSIAKLLKQMEELYFRAFGDKISPSEEFHKDTLVLDKKLTLRISVRPITQMELDAACKAAYAQFNEACRAERKRLGLVEIFKPPPPPLKLEPIEFGPWRRPS